MRVVGEASLESTNEHGALLRIQGGHALQITALEEDMIRVRIDRDGQRSVARSWMVSPATGDASCCMSSHSAPYEGRDKDALGGFSLPRVEIETMDAELRISTPRLRVIVPLGVSPLALRWEWRDVAAACWKPLLADRRSGAYYFGRHQNPRLSHHIKRRRGDRFYGLGEKSGALDKAGRRYRMDCVDAMGYDAECSDPLYKFWPFYIAKPAPTNAPSPPNVTAGSNGAAGSAELPASAAYGLFYDNPANCSFDLGCTFDNYHGLFSSYEAACGDLDYTVLLGPTVGAVTRRFAWLVGGHCLPPQWSLGYSGSTMSYTDAPDAQARMKTFLELLRAHEVPCSSFQMSSGYTSIGSKRYVFHWNHDKFPSPEDLVAHYAAAGLHLAANIKPCLLTDHPLYDECRAAGLFLSDSEAAAKREEGGGAGGAGGASGAGGGLHTPETSMFWDAVGSHLDFTNPATAAWWRAQVTEKLLAVGIGSTWNDNNEWHVDDESAVCHGFGTPTPLRLLRPVQALLMVRASLEAQRVHAPQTRPWLISRSGMPGTQRYAQTWSGDNYTSWHTLKHNIQMGIGLSLSGFFNTGHDVGGFAGPQPEPELLVRWVQNGIFHPRFTIHSWNTDLDGTPDGTCNEPWMFPEVLPLVREAIQLRYSLVPHLYSLLRRAVSEHEPLLRPTFLDHEHDPRSWEATDDFMLGESLLVASVVERGQRERKVYLPDNRGKGWWDWHDGGIWRAGGQEVTLSAPLERCPLLVRGGSLIVLAEPDQAAATRHSRVRVLRAFPLPPTHAPGSVAFAWTEDDGVTADDALATAATAGAATGDRDRLFLSCELHCSTDALVLRARATFVGEGRGWRPLFTTIEVQLPAAERRALVIEQEAGEGAPRFVAAGI